MKVLMVVEGDDSALRIEPEHVEGRALLARLGGKGVFETRLGPVPAEGGGVKDLVECYEGTPAELD